MVRVRKKYLGGTKNLFEEEVYKDLKKRKVKFKYEARKLPYVIASHYKPDWDIDTPTGTMIVETKGYFRPEDKRKFLAVRKQHPELDLRILFYRINKKDTRWAEKNGIRYAIRIIPQEWLDGL